MAKSIVRHPTYRVVPQIRSTLRHDLIFWQNTSEKVSSGRIFFLCHLKDFLNCLFSISLKFLDLYSTFKMFYSISSSDDDLANLNTKLVAETSKRRDLEAANEELLRKKQKFQDENDYLKHKCENLQVQSKAKQPGSKNLYNSNEITFILRNNIHRN